MTSPPCSLLLTVLSCDPVISIIFLSSYKHVYNAIKHHIILFLCMQNNTIPHIIIQFAIIWNLLADVQIAVI